MDSLTFSFWRRIPSGGKMYVLIQKPNTGVVGRREKSNTIISALFTCFSFFLVILSLHCFVVPLWMLNFLFVFYFFLYVFFFSQCFARLRCFFSFYFIRPHSFHLKLHIQFVLCRSGYKCIHLFCTDWYTYQHIRKLYVQKKTMCNI